MTSRPVLELEGLRVSLPGPVGPTPVLRGVDLEVHLGETLALVGESGSGKTTALLAIMGLLPPGAWLEGDILFQGRRVGRDLPWSEVRGRGVGMVFQEPAARLNPLMRAGAHVAELLVVHRGLSPRQAREDAREIMAEASLPEECFDAWPHQLSGGLAQRLALAMAAGLRPPLLLVDEPTASLDLLMKARVLTLLRNLASQGCAVLIVSHDIRELCRASDRMAVLHGGQVVEIRRSEELATAPAHPHTRALLAAHPAAGSPGRPLNVVEAS